jgi:hypothetical protein
MPEDIGEQKERAKSGRCPNPKHHISNKERSNPRSVPQTEIMKRELHEDATRLRAQEK